MPRLLPLLVLLACGEPAQDTATDTADTAVVADTWSSFGEGFMATYCVDCHDSGDKDFRVYADVVAWSAEIRCGTASTTQPDCGSWPPAEQFPVGDGPVPTAAERDQLVAWIDAGMPE